jgi:hypothetical protein
VRQDNSGKFFPIISHIASTHSIRLAAKNFPHSVDTLSTPLSRCIGMALLNFSFHKDSHMSFRTLKVVAMTRVAIIAVGLGSIMTLGSWLAPPLRSAQAQAPVAPALAAGVLAQAPAARPAEVPNAVPTDINGGLGRFPGHRNFTATTNRVWLPKAGHFAHLIPRNQMKRCAAPHLVRQGAAWPQPVLPVGYTTVNDAIIPIDDNSSYGDCGWAMIAHADNVLTFRATGTASSITNMSAFINQYLTASGGDNGSDEPMVLSAWAPPNGIAGIPGWQPPAGSNIAPVNATAFDHLDIGNTVAELQGAIAAQGVVLMAFNVPNAWINSFDQNGGAVWDGGVVGNPANGHFVPLVGVDAQGRYILLTWGSYVYVTQAGLEANGVDPECFTVATARAYNPATGLDFAGRTWAANSTFWTGMGGQPFPAWPYGMVNPVPPVNPPVPPTPPAADTIVSVDITKHTISLPSASWTLTKGTGPQIVVHPGEQTVVAPAGYQATPAVSATPATPSKSLPAIRLRKAG